jgi:hypothetical protein
LAWATALSRIFDRLSNMRIMGEIEASYMENVMASLLVSETIV